jgi:hypothetical protein
MTSEDRRLFVETIAEVKELKGEMREFKENVIWRFDKLEQKEAAKGKQRNSMIAILISGATLLINIIINFFIKDGGK